MYITTKAHTAFCPALEMDVTIIEKCSVTEKGLSPMSSTCDIIENSKLPLDRQREDIKYFRCPKDGHCDLLK